MAKTNRMLDGGQIRESMAYLDSAYRFFNHAGPADLWKKYRQKTNFYLNYEFDPDKAELYADSMYAIVKGKSSIYKQEYAWTSFFKGDVLVAKKKYEEAFQNYYDGREFVLRHLDSCNFAQFTNQLGLVRYRQEQFSHALPYLKKAVAETDYCVSSTDFEKGFILPQSIYNTIALCFEEMNMPDSAIVYYLRSIEFITSEGLRFPERKQFREIALGVVKGNLGGVYARLNKYSAAERFLKESIRINDKIGYAIQDAQTAKIKLAEVYLKLSKFARAGKLLDEVQAHLGQPGKNPANEFIRLKWYQLKWTYFDQTKNVPLAYKYLQRFQQNRDSITRAHNRLKNIDMDVIFRENEQRYKFALLGKENQLKTGYLIAAIIFLMITIGVLIAVWQNRKRLKTLNTKIITQNADMHKTLAALQQSQEENTRIMKIVAHDLRSPMAATISITAMLLESGNYPPEDAEMLELMKTSSLHSLEMIADLMNMNTTAGGLKKEPVEMHTLLRYCVNLLNFKAAEKKQKISLHAKEIVLNVSREKIWRLVSNLLVNAIKFSPEGSAIEIRMQQQENFALISIQDYGIGIPEKLKAKVFDMFTDARRPGTIGEHSFGLGLAISRQIVEAHGGRIWFESNAGQGTVFYVELPAPPRH
jgi:signal transduction histidine kinase